MEKQSSLASLCNLGLVAFQYLLIGVLWFLTVMFGFGFTIGASTVAAYITIAKIKSGESDKVIYPFFHGFFKNFIKSTIIWVIIMLIQRIAIFNLLNSNFFGSFSSIAWIINAFILFELFFISLYIFPMIAKYENKMIAYFKTHSPYCTVIYLKALRLGLCSSSFYFYLQIQYTFVFIMVPIYFFSSDSLFTDLYKNMNSKRAIS